MITTEKITESLNRELLELFPACVYYTDFSEEEFIRPSFLVLCDKRGMTRKLTRRVSEFVSYMTIIYHAETNAYYRADGMGLREVSDKLTNVFAKEYLHVENRAVRIRPTGGEIREREAYVDLEIRYTEESGAPGETGGEKMKKLYQRMK